MSSKALLKYVLLFTPLGLQAQVRSLANPVELATTPTAAKTSTVDLKVEYADFTTYNPGTGKNDNVHLRTYNGLPVGPTIRVTPGEKLHVNLINALPSDPAPCPEVKDHNTPSCFNITNLHTHGFHVSPSGNSDNVLLTVNPGQTQPYDFELPDDHPAGTFWYHSHRHGSTALQVSSGMEGALIVTGTRTFADKQKNGVADIDTVLKTSAGDVPEEIAMFQQVQYSCVDAAGALTWNCGAPTNKDNTGSIERYDQGQFGPKSWGNSGRYTTINGLVQPEVNIKAGQIYRWRLIHGGVRDTIGLRITPMNPAVAKTMLAAFAKKGISAAEEAVWTQKNCMLSHSIPQFEFASDGLTRRAMVQKNINVLQPGYRSDVLTVFPSAGVYCVVDDTLSAASQINTRDFTTGATIAKDRALLALIVVAPGEGSTQPIPVASLKDYIGKQLAEGNQGSLPAPVLNDLRQLKIAEFAPHEVLPGSPTDGLQKVRFNIGGSPTKFMVNDEPYKMNRTDHSLIVGDTDDWQLSSQVAGHPFHIHVNPFEIISIGKEVLGPDGQPIVGPDGKLKMTSIFDAKGHCTDLDGTKPDPQYCDQIGVVRDTIFVKPGYVINVRTHYDRFAGGFVLHCHILDHEDEGMMQNVFIQDPKHPVPNPFDSMDPHMQHGTQ